jgi:hypothetical protein
MGDADVTHEAARALALRRWGNTVLVKAINTIAERADQLDEAQRAALRFVIDERKDAER